MKQQVEENGACGTGGSASRVHQASAGTTGDDNGRLTIVRLANRAGAADNAGHKEMRKRRHRTGGEKISLVSITGSTGATGGWEGHREGDGEGRRFFVPDDAALFDGVREPGNKRQPERPDRDTADGITILL